MELPPAFVIHLERCKDRKEHILREFTREGVAFKFFSAFDGKKLGVATTNPYLDDHPQKFWESNPEFFVGPAVTALSLSHFAINKFCLMQGYDEWLVFEDDVVLPEGFKEKFFLLRSGLPNNYGILWLEHSCDRNKVPYREDVGLWRGDVLCTAALLISRQAGLEIEEKAVLGEPFDIFLYNKIRPQGGMWISEPKICTQLSIHGKIATTLK